MMKSEYECVLKSLDSNFPNIEICEKKVVLGRSSKIGIADKFCSKEQLILRPNYHKNTISIRVNGTNPSALNGFMLQLGTGYEAHHGDVIELLYGKYLYEVVFSKKKSIKEDIQIQSITKENDYIWEIIDGGKLAIYTSTNAKSSTKIASYDLDNTLIKTKSGNVFAKSIEDWQIIYPEVTKKLKSLYQGNFKIVIFTNQAGISKGKVRLNDFKQKIHTIITQLNVPVQVFIATGVGKYRKPMIGMWDFLEKYRNEETPIDYKMSFYVGDAAGRPENKLLKIKKDHSLSDRLMAMNVGIPFFTPEEHFLNQKQRNWTKPNFDPKIEMLENVFEPDFTMLQTDKLLIIIVGLPGSGKSYFAKTYLAPFGYPIINRDIVGTMENCLKLCEKYLKDGKTCVIDNTNVDVKTRQRYINLVKKYNFTCKCFVMNTSIDQLKHNLALRNITDSTHQKIDNMVLNSLKKNFEQPTIAEGFTEVVSVNIIPKFNNIEDENLYKMYLIEK